MNVMETTLAYVFTAHLLRVRVHLFIHQHWPSSCSISPVKFQVSVSFSLDLLVNLESYYECRKDIAKDVSQRSGSRGYSGKVPTATAFDPNAAAIGAAGNVTSNTGNNGGGVAGTATSGKRRTTDLQEYLARQPYHDGIDRQQNNNHCK